MAIQIQLRRDVAAQWTSVNPVLADGEVGIETDTSKLKLGNGASAWASLPYAVGDFASIDNRTSVLSGFLSDLISVHNVLSNRVSANSGGASVTSAEYQSLVDRVSTNSAVGGGGSVTSTEVSAVSAQAASAIAAEAATRAANDATLSAAITTVSQAVSAETTARVAADDALSASIAELSTHLSTVSNAASNALSVANAASNAASIVSAALATEIAARAASVNAVSALVSLETANRVSADDLLSNAISGAYVAAADAAVNAGAALAEAASANAAAVSVNNRVNSVNTFISGISARSVGDVSTHGLQSVIDALSNRISGVVGGTASVTSAEYTSLVNRVSANSAAGAGSVTSAEVQVASAAATSADAHANTVSARVVSVSAELASLLASASAALNSALGTEQSNRISADSTLFTGINNVSVAADAVSARLVSASAELASLIQIASAAATSADGHAQTVSARAVSISAELASLVQIASAAATSADGHANTVSARVVSVSAEVASLLASVEARLSDRIDAIPGGGSTNVVGYVSADNVICAAALTNISGMTVSVSAGVLYELKGMIMYSTSATTGHAFGLTFPAMTHAAGGLEGNKSVNMAGTSTFSLMEFGAFDGTDSGSAVWSAAVGGAGLLFLRINGTLLPSAGGVVVPQARASVATNAVTIVRGSWMRVFRLS